MTLLKKFFYVIPVLTLFACTTNKQENTSSNDSSNEPVLKSEYKVLFIGNSFTYYNSLDKLTQTIATNIGINMTCKSFTQGSHSLIEDADPNDSLGKQIFADLKENQYTDIILQDKSNFPYNHYADFKTGVKSMKDKIDPLQENADLHIYETWGYNSETFTGPIPEMEATIKTNTDMVAKAYGLHAIYVGQAFTYVYENHKDINLYCSDNRHPTYPASYLAALVHVASLTGKHVKDVTFQGEYGKTNEYGQVTFVDEVTRNTLIDVAERIVFGNN